MSGAVVIIGAGQAGIEAASTLRSKGYTDSITVIGDEPGLPYQRPPLSKSFLKGEDHASRSVRLRPLSFFADNKIDLRTASAVDIDRVGHEVVLGTGERMRYAHLVLAVGSRNRTLNIPGVELDGVHYLRTLAEAETLAPRLAQSRSVVVIGAGFIGLEVAAAARELGAQVTVVEAADRPMARALTPTMSAYFAELHEQQGVSLRLGVNAREIIGLGRSATGVVTSKGETLRADTIVVGVGVLPNTELAERAGLTVRNGIVVDQRLNTADPAISAIGDCAAYPHSHYQESGLIRLESVQNAVDQARNVADRLNGKDVPYSHVPWFWTVQFDVKLQIAGLLDGFDTAVLRGSPADGAFSVFCFAGERLIAVESVNHTRDHMAGRKLLAGRLAVTPAQAADTALDLRTLIA